MSLSRSMQLINKSIDCMVSAIELYNKPDFKYREEVFCILTINAWELLLKAKILKDNNNNLSSIYIREYLTTKGGAKSKKWKYKENRSKNKFTLEIFGALRKLQSKNIIDEVCYENVETLIEIRDNAVHFFNKDLLLAKKVLEVGTANIKSYLTLIKEWFSISLERYNFYLMPLSFFRTTDLDPILLGSTDITINKLLTYIANKEKKYPSDPNSSHNISIAIETKMVKSSSLDAQKVSITNDPNAPQFHITIEDIQKTHPLDYQELTTKLQLRYKNFKANQQYQDLRKNISSNQKLCLNYPLNPKNPTGSTKPFYSISVFEEFDKHYIKK